MERVGDEVLQARVGEERPPRADGARVEDAASRGALPVDDLSPKRDRRLDGAEEVVEGRRIPGPAPPRGEERDPGRVLRMGGAIRHGLLEEPPERGGASIDLVPVGAREAPAGSFPDGIALRDPDRDRLAEEEVIGRLDDEGAEVLRVPVVVPADGREADQLPAREAALVHEAAAEAIVRVPALAAPLRGDLVSGRIHLPALEDGPLL